MCVCVCVCVYRVLKKLNMCVCVYRVLKNIEYMCVYIIKKNEMGWACGSYGGGEGVV